MQDIYVDLVGLNQVHRTLTTIRHDLEDFDTGDGTGLFADSGTVMGHRVVDAAYEDFLYGWTDGKQRVIEQLEVAAAQIQGAVEAYTQVESSIGATATEMRGGLQ